MELKHPIGTRIIYKPTHAVSATASLDIGRQGIIVEVKDSLVGIYLPSSEKQSKRKKHLTWRTNWRNIVLVKNQQLLFDFMTEG